MIAAEGQQAGHPLKQGAGTVLDRGDGLGDIERVDAKVAGVNHLEDGERRYAGRRVAGAEQPGERRLPAVPRHLGRVDLTNNPVDGDPRLFPGKRPLLKMSLRHQRHLQTITHGARWSLGGDRVSGRLTPFCFPSPGRD